MYFYAVYKGQNPGIYNSWEECKKEVNGYKGAIYKKFSNMKEAENYMENGPEKKKNKKVKLNIKTVIAYTDGSLIRKNDYKGCGYGIYIPKYHLRQGSILFGSDNKTNNRAELSAILDCISYLETQGEYNILIYTDSMYAIQIFGETGTKYKKKKFKNIKNADLVRRAVYLRDKVNLDLEHVSAHTGKETPSSRGNDIADSIANQYAVRDYIYQDKRWKSRLYNVGKYKSELLDNIPTNYIKEYLSNKKLEIASKKNETLRTEMNILQYYVSQIDI